jgi:hypothetical protein
MVYIFKLNFKANFQDRNEIAMDDFCLENESEEEDFSLKRKKRGTMTSKSEHDNSKGINTRKKRALSTSDYRGDLNTSGSFSAGGFGSSAGFGMESSILDTPSTKRGSRGGFNTKVAKEEEMSDEDDHTSTYKNVFWKGIKEYIVPFGKADLDFCNVDKVLLVNDIQQK